MLFENVDAVSYVETKPMIVGVFSIDRRSLISFTCRDQQRSFRELWSSTKVSCFASIQGHESMRADLKY